VLDDLPDIEAAFEGDKPAVFSEAYIVRETERCLRALFVEQSLNRPAAPTLMKGMVLQLMAQLARARSALKAGKFEAPSHARTPEARVHAYVGELQSRFNENEKIDNVVSRLALSRRYFTRLFRKVTGDSWLQYVRTLRLNHAKALLVRGDRTVLAIAFESGFDDASTFYRAFKAVERTTPQEWLARQKNKPKPKERGRP
jgi:AraC family L-rhamnose operon regulatory protein RhaS